MFLRQPLIDIVGLFGCLSEKSAFHFILANIIGGARLSWHTGEGTPIIGHGREVRR